MIRGDPYLVSRVCRESTEGSEQSAGHAPAAVVVLCCVPAMHVGARQSRPGVAEVPVHSVAFLDADFFFVLKNHPMEVKSYISRVV